LATEFLYSRSEILIALALVALLVLAGIQLKAMLESARP